MASEDETGHVFNPPNSAGNFHSSQKPQSDVVVEDGTENEQPVPVSSAGKKNEKSSQAWKKNMIALNEDMETGPSRMFEAGSASTINPAVSTSSNVLHNTKLFIPGTLTSPQHSTPLKPSDKVATQSESDPVRANVSSEMESLPEQQEHTVSEAGKESTTSSSSAVPHMELHPSGNMLTPPGVCVCTLCTRVCMRVRARMSVCVHVCLYLCARMFCICVYIHNRVYILVYTSGIF